MNPASNLHRIQKAIYRPIGDRRYQSGLGEAIVLKLHLCAFSGNNHDLEHDGLRMQRREQPIKVGRACVARLNEVDGSRPQPRQRQITFQAFPVSHRKELTERVDFETDH